MELKMVKSLVKLYKDRRELTLLEIGYFAVALISFIIAGTVALFNQSLGISILIVPLLAMLAGVVNIVAWSLVKLMIEALANKKVEGKAGK